MRKKKSRPLLAQKRSSSRLNISTNQLKMAQEAIQESSTLYECCIETFKRGNYSAATILAKQALKDSSPEEQKKIVLLLAKAYFRKHEYRRVIDFLKKRGLLNAYKKIQEVPNSFLKILDEENEVNRLNVQSHNSSISQHHSTSSDNLSQYKKRPQRNFFNFDEHLCGEDGVETLLRTAPFDTLDFNYTGSRLFLIYKDKLQVDVGVSRGEINDENAEFILLGAKAFEEINEVEQAHDLLLEFLTQSRFDTNEVILSSIHQDVLARQEKLLRRRRSNDEPLVFGEMCLLLGKLKIATRMGEPGFWLKLVALFCDSTLVEAFDLLFDNFLSLEQQKGFMLELKGNMLKTANSQFILSVYEDKILASLGLEKDQTSNQENRIKNFDMRLLTKYEFGNRNYQKVYLSCLSGLTDEKYDQETILYFVDSLVELEHMEDLFYIAHVLASEFSPSALSEYSIGCFYLLKNNFPLAGHYFHRATTKTSKFLSSQISLGLHLRSLKKLALCYSVQNLPDKAIAIYRGLTLSVNQDPMCLILYGNELWKSKDFKSAEYRYILAMKILRNSEDEFNTGLVKLNSILALVYNQLGALYYSQDDFEKSHLYFLKACKVELNGLMSEEKCYHVENRTSLLYNMGHSFRKNGEIERARMCFKLTESILSKHQVTASCDYYDDEAFNTHLYTSLGFVYNSLFLQQVPKQKRKGTKSADKELLLLAYHYYSLAQSTKFLSKEKKKTDENSNNPFPERRFVHSTVLPHELDGMLKVLFVKCVQDMSTFLGDKDAMTKSSVDYISEEELKKLTAKLLRIVDKAEDELGALYFRTQSSALQMITPSTQGYNSPQATFTRASSFKLNSADIVSKERGGTDFDTPRSITGSNADFMEDISPIPKQEPESPRSNDRETMEELEYTDTGRSSQFDSAASFRLNRASSRFNPAQTLEFFSPEPEDSL
eukprot:snap_masked-scaffold_36-processed-gene-0.44-mRNA-1 protein AED:1.00 eAED:1.00 QI:0/0/0/0/1/1/4/0/942